MSDPYLHVDVRHTLGTLRLDAKFAVGARWTVLFGASGSGKSTVLRAVAGLVRPDKGRIVLGKRVLVDRATGVEVAAHERGVRWAGQTAMLFPRMTVRWNLAMGMKKDGPFAGRGWIDELEHCLDLFGLQGLTEKRPAELSGGEAQRVAVVRAAIGARGKLLLLDEPFTGLDAEVRDELIGQLRGWLGETPVISVTHDVGEAFLLDAEVVQMSEGRVVVQGAVAEVLGKERERLRTVLGERKA